MRKTDILDVISRKLSPFILLFGFYLVTYGHLSPGGGFQGGVALASGIILLLLCQGPSIMGKYFPLKKINYAEALGYLGFIMIGIAGLLAGKGFLSNFIPVRGTGDTPGAGLILFLNIIISLKVGAGITLICFYLFKEGDEND